MSLFNELKRRSVFRVAIGYLGISWLLIQVVETLFSIYKIDEGIAQVVVTVLAIGFMPAMILAWVFELTPEGIKRDKNTDRDTPAMRDFGRRLDRVVIAILSVAVIFFAVDKFWPGGPEPGPSIAVLPFTNASADPAQDYFATGMTTQLRTMLTGVRAFRVIASNTVEYYLSEGGGPRAMAEEESLQHILEGSIQSVGDRVRVTATLVDIMGGTQTWSDTFDRELDDIFAIQDEIAAAVVARLKGVVPVESNPIARRLDIEAWKLYLRAEQLLRSGARPDDYFEALSEAIPLLQQALEIEPDFIDGWLSLSLASYRLWDRNSREPDVAIRDLSDEAFEHARQINPEHPVVLAWQAGFAFTRSGDTQTIASQYERAITAAPTTADVIRPAQQFVRSIDRFDVATAMAELAVDRDPKCADCWYVLSQIYRDDGRYAESEDAAEVALALGMALEFSIAKTQLYQHNAKGMLTLFDDEYPVDGHALWGYSTALYTAGRMAEFTDVFTELRDEWGDIIPLEVAMVYAWSGGVDEAFEWIDRTIEQNPYEMQLDYRQPFFFNLHGDPRWNDVLRRIDRHPEQLAKIEFDPEIPEVAR